MKTIKKIWSNSCNIAKKKAVTWLFIEGDTQMVLRTLIAAATLTTALGTGAQAATTLFDLDYGASSIAVEYSAACSTGFFACASVSGAFRDVDNWSMDNTGDTETIDRLIDWNIVGAENGVTDFSVVATLVFASPSVSGSSSGAGSIEVSARSIAGSLIWDAPANISIGDSELVVAFDDWAFLTSALDPEFTSGATFTYADIANVPLPASVPLLMAGLGALGWAGRRKKIPD